MEGLTSASSEYRMDEPTHSLLNGPVTHTGHLYESYACHDFKAEDEPSTTVTAGAPLTVEWDLEAKHPGDCSLYISYDDDGGTYAAPKDWIKPSSRAASTSSCSSPEASTGGRHLR